MPGNLFGALKTRQNEKSYSFWEIGIPATNTKSWQFSKPNSILSSMPLLHKNIWMICKWNCSLVK